MISASKIINFINTVKAKIPKKKSRIIKDRKEPQAG